MVRVNCGDEWQAWHVQLTVRVGDAPVQGSDRHGVLCRRVAQTQQANLKPTLSRWSPDARVQLKS